MQLTCLTGTLLSPNNWLPVHHSHINYTWRTVLYLRYALQSPCSKIKDLICVIWVREDLFFPTREPLRNKHLCEKMVGEKVLLLLESNMFCLKAYLFFFFSMKKNQTLCVYYILLTVWFIFDTLTLFKPREHKREPRLSSAQQIGIRGWESIFGKNPWAEIITRKHTKLVITLQSLVLSCWFHGYHCTLNQRFYCT